MKRPLIIGVTGGIASGKSTLARMIAGRGIAHFDADKMVHKLLQYDPAAIAAITAAFPNVSRETMIDRAALAQHIAKHPESLKTLETILHPRVRASELHAIDIAHRNKLRALILDIPLLFETDTDQLCDVVVVAYAPLAHRRARAFARAGMTEEKWQRLLSRQLLCHHHHSRADVVIHTGIGKAQTRRQIASAMCEWGL